MTGPGGSTRIEPKVMLVLVCLAEHPGRWSRKTACSTPRGPTPRSATMSSRARSPSCAGCSKMIQSSRASSRRFPKVGYRLIAPVLLSAQGDVAPATLPTNGTPSAANLLPGLESRAARPRPRYGRAVAIGLAGIAVAVLAIGRLLPGFRTPPQPAMRVVPLTAIERLRVRRSVLARWSAGRVLLERRSIGRRRPAVAAGQLGHLHQGRRILGPASTHDRSRHRHRAGMVPGWSPDRLRAHGRARWLAADSSRVGARRFRSPGQ